MSRIEEMTRAAHLAGIASMARNVTGGKHVVLNALNNWEERMSGYIARSVRWINMHAKRSWCVAHGSMLDC